YCEGGAIVLVDDAGGVAGRARPGVCEESDSVPDDQAVIGREGISNRAGNTKEDARHRENSAKPEQFSWIRRVCSIFLRKSSVVRRLQIASGYAHSSLLVLRKNLLRNHILPN